MKGDHGALDPGWQGVVLVCGECERRKDGPGHLSAKHVRKLLKRELRGVKPSLRIVETSCMGTCPKKALMLAALRSGEPLAASAVTGDDEVLDAASTWMQTWQQRR
jgi:predicted metal-binding protein